LYSASGNPTALVEGKPDITLAKEILGSDKRAEQVGFLSDEDGFTLTMAGGEFCGNALRCAAFEFLGGKPGTVSIGCSGTDEYLSCGVSDQEEEGCPVVWAKMPKALGIEKKDFGFLVRFPGIVHAVIGADCGVSPEELLNLLKKDEKDAAAIGIISVKDDTMYPVVWVRGIDTLYHESACGSGCAAAAYAYGKSVRLRQPSGKFLSALYADGAVILSGPVELL
ncbi:MAG: hypothetical protein IKZ78_02735, partial [Firmicutes bacterium]|nr:hypothetical protein [Bacillota bacterium]